MKVFTLCLALMLCAPTAKAAAQDDTIRNLISNLVFGIAVLNTNVIHYKGITNAWLGTCRASMAFSNTTEVLTLTTTPTTITNYTRAQLSRNCFADRTNGTVVVTNAGTYLVNFGATIACANANRTITNAIFVNGSDSGIRYQQNLTAATMETGRTMALIDLLAMDVVSVRSSVNSASSMTIYEGSLSLIRQDD